MYVYWLYFLLNENKMKTHWPDASQNTDSPSKKKIHEDRSVYVKTVHNMAGGPFFLPYEHGMINISTIRLDVNKL